MESLGSGLLGACGTKKAVALVIAATHATAELMQLRQPEALGSFYEDNGGVWHIDARGDCQYYGVPRGSARYCVARLPSHRNGGELVGPVSYDAKQRRIAPFTPGLLDLIHHLQASAVTVDVFGRCAGEGFARYHGELGTLGTLTRAC